MKQIPKHMEPPPEIRKRSLLFGGFYSAILVGFFAIVEIIIYFVVTNRIHQEIDLTQKLEMRQLGTRLTNLVAQQKNEFLIMASSDATRQCLTHQRSNECADSLSWMKTMMKVNKNIDHLRLINLEGFEIVRVNRNLNGRTVVVPDAKLQNKEQKPYFKMALKTKNDEMFISRIDLNMENGKVEHPPKPIIRFGKRVYSVHGEVIGVAVANYKTRMLLEKLSEAIVHLEDNWYLLNQRGFYLRGTESTKEFSFMYPERTLVGFFSDFADVWKNYQASPHLPYINDKGKFYFQTVALSQFSFGSPQTRKWVLVMHVSPRALAKATELLRMGLIIGALLLCPILAALGWKAGRFNVRQKWYLDEFARNSITDNLTGLLNHRGLMERFNPTVAIANRRNSPLVVVFVDVNDLKTLNDHMGHQMGDKLIQSTAQALIQTVRQTDIVGRLGGDEFIVALIDCSFVESITVMERVENTLARMGIEEIGSPWSISWGCTQRESNDSAEQMISRADQQMYFQKNAYKTGRREIHASMQHNA